MEERYVAFDVETPNAQNRRMSAIGVSVIERGEIVQELYTLVDPQTHFDPFNKIGRASCRERVCLEV